MPKFAANLSTMFTELPAHARFQAARDAGFTAIEYLNPYDHSIAEVCGWLEDAGLEMILLNTQAGDEDAGECGLAALPGREADFCELFDRALDYAAGLGAGIIHLLAGVVAEGTPREAYERAFIANTRWAADVARTHGVKILLEPLNRRDIPGYLHARTVETRRLIDAIDRDNVRLQFDFYHLQVMEGDLGEGLRRHLDVIGHVQFSSLPGRHEPQHGEVNVSYLFELLDKLGYQGWVGCEYRPKTTTLEGLRWGAPYNLGR